MATKPTGQNIVTNALIAIGICSQNGKPSVSDSQAGLDELNAMWDAWGVDEGLIYAETASRFPLTQNYGVYTIGPGAAFNAPVPQRIYKARFTVATAGAISSTDLNQGGQGYAENDTGVVLGANGSQATYTVNTVSASGAVLTFTISTAGTGYIAGFGFATQTAGNQPGTGSGFTIDITAVTAGGEHRTELNVVPAEVYYGHRDLQAQALVPDELYPDYDPDAAGFARLYLFPIPNGAAAAMLELEMAVPFLTWALTTAYNLPSGAQDPIQYALAWRLIPRYGAAVSQEIVQVIGELAEKAEQRFRDAVAKYRQLPAPVVAPANAPPRPAGEA